MVRRLKARGERGSWFAVVEGERLPCVHMHWFQFRTSAYHDPWLRPGEAKADELFEALQAKGRAIFTDDNFADAKGSGRPLFERTGYRMIYTVVGVVLDGDGLRFTCAAKVAELE